MPSTTASTPIGRRAFSRLLLAGVMAALLAFGLGGCTSDASSSSSSSSSAASSTTSDTSSGSTSDEPVSVSVASLRGPTSIGMVKFMSDADAGTLDNDYTFTISGTADEVVPQIIQGQVDIALVPANVAATAYNRTNGNVCAVDINTLGVLSVVSGDESIQSIDDLAGHTVYMTGKGTTPDYVMNYLLEQAGIADQVTLEFKSEATEVSAILAEDPTAVGVLPEPYTTAVCMKNPDLAAQVSLSDAWDIVQGETGGTSRMVTGVTIVNKDFLEAHPDVVEEFIEQHRASTEYVNENIDEAAPLVVQYGIMDSEDAAAQAIPECNIVCLTGDEMKDALSGYLQVLYDQDNSSVGGAMPADDFYFGTDA